MPQQHPLTVGRTALNALAARGNEHVEWCRFRGWLIYCDGHWICAELPLIEHCETRH